MGKILNDKFMLLQTYEKKICTDFLKIHVHELFETPPMMLKKPWFLHLMLCCAASVELSAEMTVVFLNVKVGLGNSAGGHGEHRENF